MGAVFIEKKGIVKFWAEIQIELVSPFLDPECTPGWLGEAGATSALWGSI